jgi:glycosyltransferase involved in cell wall biosynthesis
MDNQIAWCQLDGRNLPIRYWLQGQSIQNFGDFLTEFLLERLFLPYGMKARAFHLIGSCIDDVFFDDPLKQGSIDTPEEYAARRVVFWGCGIRKPGGLSDENRQRAEILAVRGPLTRSALMLGNSVPLGDPAFLLPAIHQPTHSHSGKTICIPHFNDKRSDSEIIALSGCDSILRPNMPNNRDRLLHFIDSIVAADFVLASSLHGAIVAAAYNRPFAFWDSGCTDLPFKWMDLAELVSIPCKFAKTLKEGVELYSSDISPNYKRPKLWPLLTSAPFVVRSEALIRVLRYDLQQQKNTSLENDLNQILAYLNQYQAGKGRFRDYFGQTPASALRSLRLEVKKLTDVLIERDRDISKLSDNIADRDREITKLFENVADRDREITKLSQTLSQTIEERNREVNRLGSEISRITEQNRNNREALKQELATKNLDLLRLNARLDQTIQEAQALRSSRIWRFFRPLRGIKRRSMFMLTLSMCFAKNRLRHNVLHPFRFAGSLRRQAKSALLILQSGIFDRNWYLKQNGEIASLKIDPVIHYVCTGVYEGWNPNPLFDTNWYLRQYPDIAQTGINPLTHYILDGACEGRDPSPLFDTDWYLQRYPDVSQSGLNPLKHYLDSGAYEDRDPHPLFDADWYLQRYPDLAQAGSNPLVHYICFGAHEGRDPNPCFDSDWYLQQNPDVAQTGDNPLVHYLCHGAREGRDPNPYFDSDWYLNQNPDIAESGINPLTHYILYGAAEHRNPSRNFDGDWYLANNSDAAALGINPLKHFLSTGIKEGRLPKAPVAISDPSIHENDGNTEKNDLWHNAPANGGYSSRVELNQDPSRPKLLMIDSIYPKPDRDSGSIDTVNYIKLFQEFGYQIIFAADAEFNLNHDIHQSLEDQGVLCLRSINYVSINRFIEHAGQGIAAAFLSRVHCGGRFYESIRKINPQSRIIFNTVDLHGLREEREARLKNDFKALHLASRTNERERYLARQCDATIVVSKLEQQWLESEAPGSRILHIPLMRDCPGRQNEFEEREGICFVGSYLHTPNVDAVKYFLDSIWPAVREKLPLCKFYIVGSNLPDEIASRTDPNVEMVGHVPDLRSFFERMRLSVAPLRFGAGAKGKVVSSLANGLPCIASNMATEGMNLKDNLHLAIENTPEGFADRIVRIYNDKDFWNRLSDAGCEFCSSEFSLNVGRERLSALFEKLRLPIAKASG